AGAGAGAGWRGPGWPPRAIGRTSSRPTTRERASACGWVVMESGTWSSSSRAPGDGGTVDDFAPAPAPDAFAAFLDRYTDFGPAPLVPEVRVFQARGVLEVWEAAERLAGRPMPAPFWAFAWAGGLALARVLLDSPARVRGRRVLDIGTGGGVVALAAALAGAREVVANDRDPWALATACLAAERQSLA